MNSADTRPSLSQVKRAIKKRVVFTPNNRCYHLPCLTSSPWCELRVSLDTSTPVPDSTRRERWCAGSRLEEDGQRWHLLPNMGNCLGNPIAASGGKINEFVFYSCFPLYPLSKPAVAVICLSRVKLTSQTGFLPAKDKKVTVLFSTFFLSSIGWFVQIFACLFGLMEDFNQPHSV